MTEEKTNQKRALYFVLVFLLFFFFFFFVIFLFLVFSDPIQPSAFLLFFRFLLVFSLYAGTVKNWDLALAGKSGKAMPFRAENIEGDEGCEMSPI